MRTALFVVLLSTAPLGQKLGFLLTEVPAGDGPRWVAATDIDGDGDNDLVTANAGGGTVGVMRALGSGTYGAPETSPAGSLPSSLALADFDGDGRVDAAVSSAGDGTVRLVSGLAVSPTSTLVATIGATPAGLASADLDGDGFLDLALGTLGAGDVHVLLGDGAGAFATALVHPTASCDVRNVVTADVDGDGLQDVVAAQGLYEFRPVVLRQLGGGAFAPVTGHSMTGAPVWVAVADTDQDGDVDLVAPSDDGLSVLPEIVDNDGTGVFTFAGFAGCGLDYLEIGDVDADGFPDLAMIHDFAGICVKPSFPSGSSFGGATLYLPVGEDPTHLAVGDLDGDGRDDIAVANEGSDEVYVFTSADCGPPILTDFDPPVVPNVPPGPAPLVRMRGCGLAAVTAVEVDGSALPSGTWFIRDDLTIDFVMPLVSKVGSVGVRVTTAYGKAIGLLQVAPTSPPLLELVDADPETLSIAAGARLTMASGPADLYVLAVSPHLLPTSLPGVVDLEIGSGFTSLHVVAAPFLGASGWTKTIVDLTGAPVGAKVHFQGAVLLAATGALPLVASNVQSGTIGP